MSANRLRRWVGRLLWIGFEEPRLTDELSRTLSSGDAGGVILFARNLPVGNDGVDLTALTALNGALHRAGEQSGERLFIAVDQEGGRVQRVREPAAVWPPMYHLAELPDDEAEVEAERIGRAVASDLASWGFDVDFAPVLDVHSNPDNPIIGDRAFSSQPEAAALRALAFARGLKVEGIIGCGKHFPGHGDTTVDSHLELPRLDHEMARLESVELVPFKRAVEAGLPMIMTAHVIFSAIDSRWPATLSEAVVGGLLRRQLGYRGVVVSDDLDMKAIADNFSVGEAAVLALLAGCDVLLLCRNRDHQEEVRDVLTREASSSAAFRKRVEESAALIGRLPG